MTGTEKMDLVFIGKSKNYEHFAKPKPNKWSFKNSTTRLRGKTGQRLLNGSGISMPRCTGGECFSWWTTRRVTMVPLNATMSSWNSCRQIGQNTFNHLTQVSLIGSFLDQHLSRIVFSDMNHTGTQSTVSNEICLTAPGCNPHQNWPEIKYPRGCVLCYIKLGGGTRSSDSQLLK